MFSFSRFCLFTCVSQCDFTYVYMLLVGVFLAHFLFYSVQHYNGLLVHKYKAYWWSFIRIFSLRLFFSESGQLGHLS